jgi:3-hydroxymyristoyl/3-hydroxydecanoyl-(acyl carrier protein) dehydratase
LAHIDIRFEQAVMPPVEIQLSARMLKMLGKLQMCEVIAEAGSQVIARGSITLFREGASS